MSVVRGVQEAALGRWGVITASPSTLETEVKAEWKRSQDYTKIFSLCTKALNDAILEQIGEEVKIEAERVSPPISIPNAVQQEVHQRADAIKTTLKAWGCSEPPVQSCRIL